MTTSRKLRKGLCAATAALLATTLAPMLAQSATAGPVSQRDGDVAIPLVDSVEPLADRDIRRAAAPTQSQRDAVAALGVRPTRWSVYGTPTSLLPVDGVLAKATGAAPAEAARTWLRDNAAVFGLTAADMDASHLELVNVQRLADTDARAVLFRQVFGGLVSAEGGQVTVTLADSGDIVYATSSLARTTAAPPAANLSPLEGWLKAAANVGRGVSPTELPAITQDVARGWTRLGVPGLATEQQARLAALAIPGDGVRPVVDANVVDVHGGHAAAWTVLVDAVTGDVLWRHDLVDHHEAVFGPFEGTVDPATGCGPAHPFELTDALTRSINALAVGSPTDDFVLHLLDSNGETIASGDLATNPEAVSYSATLIPAGTYSVKVCEFEPGSVIIGSYGVGVQTSNSGIPSPTTTADPKWRWFTSVPDMASTATGVVPHNSSVLCWISTCDEPAQGSPASAPWDQINSVPTFTTVGNNANTHEAWVSPLTPGGTAYAPVSPTREYTGDFTDEWNENACDPTNFVPGVGNDIGFSVTNLFVAHNRMHDYSYHLGFTEQNYNMQYDNRGMGGRPGDAEIGNAQAGAAGTQVFDETGVATGRNNANQITLQDGTPGITNQYLFQPVAGAFYAPCTDGGLDMGIVGHEYTHAISNRMVAGPDQGLTSEQGGAMGESWSDLVAGEYMFSHGFDNGGSPWAVGAYATGNTAEAIRDYAIDKNPLNYSDYGFDSPGPEVHSDGEIWNGTQWEVRQALVEKYAAQYPYGDATRQKACARGTASASPLPAGVCPGNRRWIQLVFDSFLLQASGAVTMLDMRDAMLAADLARTHGDVTWTGNQKELWQAFARRGMGANASAVDGEDTDPVPSFASPTAGENTAVTFTAPHAGKVYVGHYEARATPIADTDPASGLAATADFVPGTYELLFVSPAGGFQRSSMTVTAGEAAKTVSFAGSINLAAAANGASVIGTRGLAEDRNPEQLIDGTEATNWGAVTTGPADEAKPAIAIDLAGGTQAVKRVQVSAMLQPLVPACESPIPVAVEDCDSASRMTGLRQFALEKCDADCASPTATWTEFYTSPANAFPAVRPRPVAPKMTMREFDVPDTTASAVRLVVLENQCTGYEGYAGELDNDPTNDTDCKTASDRGTITHVSELQVFGDATTVPTTGPSPTTTASPSPSSTTSASPSPTATASPTPTAGACGKVTTKVKLKIYRKSNLTQVGRPKIKAKLVLSCGKVTKRMGRWVIRIDGKKYKSFAVRTNTIKKLVKAPRFLRSGTHKVRVVFKPRDPKRYPKATSPVVTYLRK